MPLDDVGREQAQEIEKFFRDKNITEIYSSPAIRCRETTEIIANNKYKITFSDDLWEVSVGLWEGLSFSEIQERWHDIYEERGKHLGTVAPPDGESFLQASERMDREISGILENSTGDIVIVSHGGIIRSWLCKIGKLDIDDVFTLPQPWGGISTVEVTSNGFKVISVGEKPKSYPGKIETLKLLDNYGTPENIRQHCKAVEEKAVEIVEENGINLDIYLLKSSCELHDIARTEGKIHPQKGAEILKKAGYPILADIIARHHDLGADPSPEAEVLFLADKLIEGTQPVTIEERFEASKKKCTTPEAMSAWERRYKETMAIYRKYISEK
jgi:putative nucleotidyltransferase with HDIG domain